MSFFFLDPDRRLFSKDKVEHFAGGLVVGVALAFLAPPFWRVMLYAFCLLTGFELGQMDAARGTEYEGRVGYGFGLLDLAVGLVGAALGGGLGGLW